MTSRIERFAEALGSRYEVERELGTGGTATVYLAKDLEYQRRVAVKVFRPEVAEAMGHERFVRDRLRRHAQPPAHRPVARLG
ncbi:MAG: hypothetical protein IPK33_13220 [Gemmatimonadetes bacterium]|nr:hypothetical protein [Gemmatimonadota bacterium]